MDETLDLNWSEGSGGLSGATEEIGPRYVDRSLIGRGGMNEVFCVRDRRLGRLVALKRPRTDVPPGSDRLRREAEVLASLDHPAVVPVFDVGFDGGQPAYVMKLLQRQSLWDLIRRRRDEGLRSRSALPEFLPIVLRVGEALAHAHSRGVLHLDLKPGNVIVEDTGGVFLVDFGLTEKSGTVLAGTAGTPGFMAPEQAGEQQVDERTDVFGLGAILHAAMTFRPLYIAPDKAERRRMARECRPQDYTGLDLPVAVRGILDRALARDPGERYPSVHAMVEAIRSLLLGAWRLDTRDYEPGVDIVREGETAGEAFFIVSGRCEVLRETTQGIKQLRILGEGEAFGEIGFLIGEKRTATVRSLDPVRVAPVSRERFQSLLDQAPILGPFASALARRVVELTDELLAK